MNKENNRTVLVTRGAGYIAAIIVELLEQRYKAVAIDNLANESDQAVENQKDGRAHIGRILQKYVKI